MPDPFPPDALMYRVFDGGFCLIHCPRSVIDYWRRGGFTLLLDSRAVVVADLDDVRRDEERRGDL